ncbi:hypothetical protein [Nocardiopsis metallicus]
MNMETHAIYRIILALHAIGHADGDIKLAWSIPSGRRRAAGGCSARA